MIRKLAGYAVLALAIIGCVCSALWFGDTFLPTVAPAERAARMGLATLALGAPLAWWLAYWSPTHRLASAVRLLGVAGWVVLFVSQKSLGIDWLVGYAFILLLPMIAVVFGGSRQARQSNYGEPPVYASKRATYVVLAIGTLVVLLASAKHIPVSASVFLALLAVVQGAGAAFPDYVVQYPRRGDAAKAEQSPEGDATTD